LKDYYGGGIMGVKVYLRPCGIVWGEVAETALAEGAALPLAGGPGAFLAAQLIEGEPGATKTVVVRTATLAMIEEPAIISLLSNITSPRPDIAGLTLDRTRIMAIVNVTPDSFSDGGSYGSSENAVSAARALVAEGADILDVGGESTRPGADCVPADEELARVLPVLQALAGVSAPKSIDTRKAVVMRAAIEAGADIINDVSALSFEEGSLWAAVKTKAPVILMHDLGDPKTMQDNPDYRDALLEVYDYLEERMKVAIRAGIPQEKLIIDPGVGFGKTLDHNLRILSGLSIFHGLGAPILLGASRKRLIGAVSGATDPKDRMPGSIAAALAAAEQGVQIVRVHDVAATRQALDVWRAAVTGRQPPR
jgi:dihydropteroate synthase